MKTIKKACKGTLYPKSSSVSRKLKKGGSFDLNKDGKTTFKDVLIGRGVLPKTAKKGTKIKKAQAGIRGLMKVDSNGKEYLPKMKAPEKYNTPKAPPLKIKTLEKPAQPRTAPTTDSLGRPLMKKGGKTPKSMMKSGGKMTKKCKYGCK